MTQPPTTVSLHTPPGRGGIAVVVLRGPGATGILARAFRPLAGHASAADGLLRLGRLLDGDRVLDEAIVCLRGEAAEINIHGGPAAAAAVLGLLSRLGAAVLPAPAAAPLDFPAAHPALANPAVGEEMLQALPAARSDLAAAAVTQQWAGGLSALASRALAGGASAADPRALANELRGAADRLPLMRRLLCPAEVVLAGPPNVGKSTLANALVGREVSLVDDQPGTTRDWVRELALPAGVPVWVTDTAGLWDAPDEVDAEAVRRARQRIHQADLVLLLGAGSRSDPPEWLLRPPSASAPCPTLNAAAPGCGGRRVLHVATKTDLHPPFAGADAAVCAPTGDGLDALCLRIADALGVGRPDPAAPAAFTDRQAALLHAAADALDRGDAPAAARSLHALLRR